ncbi:hypothetical protein Tco_0212312 [Tanacetum coccineum]
MIFNKFNRLSRINDDLFTCEIEVPKPTPCVKQRTGDPTHNDPEEFKWKINYDEYEKIYAEEVIFINKRLIRLVDVTIKRKRETYAREFDMEYNPCNLVFDEWLASKFYNHLEMDWYIKNALWVYWMRGEDEVILSDDEIMNHGPKMEYHMKYVIIFANLSISKMGKLTCNSNDNGFCNGRELPGMVRVGYMTYFQDYEWYDELKDSSLKEEALKQKAIMKNHRLQEYKWKVNDHECSPFTDWRDHIRGPYMNYYNNAHDEKEQEDEERCELFDDPAQEPPICKIRRFELIKYSFGQEEEYVAIKEYKYDDLTRTNDDAFHAYQEIFCNMDEGWLVTRA